GEVSASSTPRLEAAKSVSGDVTVTDAAGEGDISIGSVSGGVHVKSMKARGLEVGSVSGDIILSNITCERLGAKSVSGEISYDGALASNGRFNLNTHSGDVNLVLVNPNGFELDASTFSGEIHSDLPLTIGGDAERTTREERRRERSNRQVHATFGDSSGMITIRTFS